MKQETLESWKKGENSHLSLLFPLLKLINGINCGLVEVEKVGNKRVRWGCSQIVLGVWCSENEI